MQHYVCSIYIFYLEVTINRLKEQLRSHENNLQEKATVRVVVSVTMVTWCVGWSVGYGKDS